MTIEVAPLTARAAALVQSGRSSASDQARAALARAEAALDLGSLVALEPQRVLAAARSIDVRAEQGDSLGALAGVPFVVKDNIDVAGWPTTACTPALQMNIAAQDATIVARLRAADALVLGKAVMHELAMGGTSNNPGMPPVRNPRAPDRIAGGSSGGSAAAVAAGLCPFALGSDTGGSVVIPAALCGIAGLRPTMGRYSSAGLFVTHPTRDTIGPMAATAADLQLVDSVITGAPPRTPPPATAIRLGLERGFFWRGLDPAVQAPLEEALNTLTAAGVHLSEVVCSQIEELSELTSRGLRIEPCQALGPALTATSCAPSADQLRSATRSAAIAQMLGEISAGRGSPADLEQSLAIHRPALQRAFAEALDGFDALLVPSVILAAAPLDTQLTVTLNGREAPLFVYTRNTVPVANAGLPMVTFPAGSTDEGLPVGLSLIGRAGDDPAILALASALEVLLRA